MVQALSAFLDFCYLVRHASINKDTLDAIDVALTRFHANRMIFEEAGVRPTGFSLPQQHSLKHYRRMIQLFGAPNGLCSSITESKHIKAIKEPWRRSNHYEALEQMLLSNQHLDKLEAAHALFITRSMLTTNFRPVEGILPGHMPNDLHNKQEARPHDGPKVTAEVFLARTPGT